MKNINVGIIGAGLGLRCIFPKFRDIANVNIAGILASNYSHTLEIADRYKLSNACKSVEEMCAMPGIDLICVASPTKYHFEQASYVIANNIHMLCEKPLCLNFGQTQRLIDLFEGTEKLCLIDLELRFNPYFKKVKELIECTLGRIYFIQVHFQSSLYRDDSIKNTWNLDGSMGGGIRLAIFPHLLDLLLFWLGDKQCISLKGFMSSLDASNKTSDFCSADLCFENDISVHLSASAVGFGDKAFSIIIMGEKGVATFDLDKKLLFNSDAVCVDIPDYYNESESIFRSSFGCYARSIIDAIRNDKRNTSFTTGEEMLRLHRLLEDVQLSADSGREIVYRQAEKNLF
ncbi:putative dehydrogenase [Anaerobacterium chartisolvens]|uniref:Putative dehydrogenase n=1 Tax=Anaerobacterium chartisolvens TaxID=1297424 RepID=A0A369BD27_9FIRM|nr:Gfo/Idh/MocA family oxidoreductase [Anaerobacterium chartisolvens]RCX19443.1 putative dehydrogenase [Anaerobacterium chartisolvens]